MNLAQTRNLGIPVHWFDETPSTNLTLERLWEDDPALVDGTLVVTATQTAGRGRQGRGWEMPPGKALAVSMLVRGSFGLAPSWLPLMVGSAVVRASSPWFPGTRLGVKWPNDVHVIRPDGSLGAKLNGILCQLLGDGSAIVGVGTNLFMTREELPTERAGSWLTEGADIGGATSVHDDEGGRIADAYLARFVTELRDLVSQARADSQHVRRTVATDSATLGTDVRVMLPGDVTVLGRATGLGDDGALRVRCDDGELISVHAGDIEHLRER